MEKLAIQCMTAILTLIGITDLTQTPSSDWKIDQAWKFNGSTYQVTLTSFSLARKCSDSPNSYIWFPAVYYAGHEVYAGQRLLTKMGSRDGSQSTFLASAPVVSCREVQAGDVLTWNVYSPSQYYARITTYPQVLDMEPLTRFFGETMYACASVVLFMIALLIFLFVSATSNLRTAFLLAAFPGLSAIYIFLNCLPAFGLSAPTIFVHRIGDMSLLLSTLAIAYVLLAEKMVPKLVVYLQTAVAIISLYFYLSVKTSDAIQFATFINFLPVILMALIVAAKMLVIFVHSRTLLNGLRALFGVAFCGTYISEIIIQTWMNNLPSLVSFGSLLACFVLLIYCFERMRAMVEERDQLRMNLEKQVEEKTASLQNALKETLAAQNDKLSMAAQVSHDIRSPLTALNLLLEHSTGLPEDLRILVRGAVARIQDIARTLLEKSNEVEKGTHARQGLMLLPSLIDSIVTEKRVQFGRVRGVEVDFSLSEENYGIFAQGNAVELKRILSNVINNSFESLGESGRICVELRATENCAQILVTDNGSGIAPETMKLIGQKGLSFNKPGGSGLGLYHAKTEVDKMKGRLRISSEVGKGTTVLIELVRSKPADWFAGKIEIGTKASLVIADDDRSPHVVWERRFEVNERLRKLDRAHLYSPKELETWIDENRNRDFNLLIDFEFQGSAENGIDVISRSGLAKRCTLVTSRYEDRNIQEACLRNGIKMVPKSMMNYVPIVQILE